MMNLSCIICTEALRQNGDVRVTKCGHLFHVDCVNRWLERSNTCPQCRNDCTQPDLIRVYFNSLPEMHISAADVSSLLERLNNANKSFMANFRTLKEEQNRCLQTIFDLVQTNKKNQTLITNYSEQCNALRAEIEDLRKEVKSLKQQNDMMKSVSKIINASKAEAEMLLKSENDAQKLSMIAAALKRELQSCESIKNGMSQSLVMAQNNIKTEIDAKRKCVELMSQLKIQKHQLTKKIKKLRTTTVINPLSLSYHQQNIISVVRGRARAAAAARYAKIVRIPAKSAASIISCRQNSKRTIFKNLRPYGVTLIAPSKSKVKVFKKNSASQQSSTTLNVCQQKQELQKQQQQQQKPQQQQQKLEPRPRRLKSKRPSGTDIASTPVVAKKRINRQTSCKRSLSKPLSK